ncbi:DsbA family oxidoreductase [Paenimyroides tangerinum]|uniref:DsbA family oxidoreductase n=1 Tax=Paenimyroides tangerinum TaxID=2488728 RepID=A0A3P3WE30_9FLAO|nr:DsbA family oxidoreductase [Paenimyroides tangerinum]RRJ92668.1 DsbA family oxidoreductase [Paenimyroides tangerinum]
MKVQIWSDIMCPFCYIGKKNFEKALDNLPFKDKIEIEWKSFQLDPTLSETSGEFTTKQYLMEKKGFSEVQYNQMQERLNAMGKAVGIDFSQTSPIAANTLKAHKLLHLAKQFGKQDELKELLLKAHFEKGLNVADSNVLIDLGNAIGIDSEVISKALNDDAIAYEVQQDILEAQNIGVTGVPFFVLNNKYAVSGAQPQEVFIDAMKQAYNEIEVLNQNNDANSCSIDGCE